MPEQQGTDWASLLAQGLAWYMGRGTSGDTPNSYPVPQTPEQKRWDDARYDLYKQGGTEGQQAVRSAAQQYMGGLPRTANPTFASPMMRGQPFAGGAMFPKVDISKFNVNAKPPGAASTPLEPPGPGDAGRPTGDDRRESKTFGTEDPLNPRGGGGPFGPSPYGLDKIPPTGAPAQTPGETWNSFTTWWADYRQKNPNWKTDGAKAAITAAGAIYGGVWAAKLFRTLFSLFPSGEPTSMPAPSNTFGNVAQNAPGTQDQNGATPLPNPTRSFADIAKNAPGTKDQFGNPPAPSGGYRIDPRTGQVTRENDPFNYGGFAGGANAANNAAFWRGLQTGPGGGPYGGGSGDAATGADVMNRPTGGRRLF